MCSTNIRAERRECGSARPHPAPREPLTHSLPLQASSVVAAEEWREKTRAHTDEARDGVRAAEIRQSETGRRRNIRNMKAEDFHGERNKKKRIQSRARGAPADTRELNQCSLLARTFHPVLVPCCHFRSFSPLELLEVLVDG